MFKIGEFSRLTQVSVRMLRYYDEMGLLKPAHIDSWTGYRMYSVEQIPALNKIIYLRDSGFGVAEIASALACRDDRLIAKQLDDKYEEICKTIREEQEKLEKIKTAKKEILNGAGEMHYNVVIKSIPEYQVLSLRKKIPDYYCEGGMWQEMSAFAREQRISVSGETFSIYHDMEFKERDVDVELCARVTKTGRDGGGFTYRMTEAVPSMACTMVYGDFSNIAGAYLSFARWLQDNGQYRMYGQNRQIVHRGPWNEENPENYLVEIQIPIEKMGENPEENEEIH